MLQSYHVKLCVIVPQGAGVRCARRRSYMCRISAVTRQRTDAQRRVAIAILTAGDDRFYGYDLSRRAHVRSGVLYPMLDRWLEDEWVTDDWETPDQLTAKRPRRYYVLTDLGRRELGAIADEARDLPQFRGLFGTQT